MNFKQKVIYFLSMAALPLFGCQKEPAPETPHTDSVETNFHDGRYEKTIDFSWEYFVIGPHYDHVQFYVNDPMCVSLQIVPDSTDQSVKWSSWKNPNQWIDIANRFEDIKNNSQEKAKFGGVIYVAQITDDASSVLPGMDKWTANHFKELGFTIKEAQGKAKNNFATMPKETPQAMPSKKQRDGNYEITYGHNHFRAGPCEDHVACRAAQYSAVTIIPDSTLWSVVEQCGSLGREDWDYIAAQFKRYQDQYSVIFKGNLYPFPGRMSPEAQTIFKKLGLNIIETQGAKSAPAMPWNQAQEMLRNKQR